MKKWDFETVKIEAQKYNYRKDFCSQSLGAYKAAQRNGWLDLVCAHMRPLWEKKWTLEAILREAKKYRYKSEFIKKSPVAYNTACRNGWLNEVYEFLEEKPAKWDFINVAKEARRFDSRKEFQVRSYSAYNAARRSGWLDDVCKHMIAKKNIWNIEKLRHEAKKYSSRTEFLKKSSSAYYSAQRNGWLDDVCAHMKRPNIKWTPEVLKVEALKYQTRKAFSSSSESAYQAARKLGILDEICSHMKTRLPWTFKRVLNEAKKYQTRTDFRNGSHQAARVAVRNDWFDDVCAHMDVLWEKKWDYDTVLKEAKRYRYRSDFSHGSPGAYGAALRMGCLNACQAHMEDRPLKWTDERIAHEAAKYESRGEFAKGSGSAYKAASDRGILDDVCKHMKILYNGYKHCVYVIKNERLKKAYIGITSQKYELRMQQHRSDNNPCLSREIINLADTECKKLTDYIYTPGDVKRFAEQKFVDQFEAYGFDVINNKKSIGSVGYSKRKWTRELCHREALKYTTKWEFQRFSMNVYCSAKSHGWLEYICSHMESPIKQAGYWTKQRCIEEAKKYKSRNEFRVNATYPYKIMSMNNWSDEVCAHMPTVVYRKWEHKKADPEVWKRAKEFYKDWIKLGRCSGFVLSRHCGLKGHKLNSMVKQFENGWIPFEDELWIEWVRSL